MLIWPTHLCVQVGRQTSKLLTFTIIFLHFLLADLWVACHKSIVSFDRFNLNWQQLFRAQTWKWRRTFDSFEFRNFVFCRIEPARNQCLPLLSTYLDSEIRYFRQCRKKFTKRNDRPQETTNQNLWLVSCVCTRHDEILINTKRSDNYPKSFWSK